MFCLIPKILNAVDVVLSVSKLLAVVYPVMVKTTDIQHAVTIRTIRINYAAQYDFPCNNRKQAFFLFTMTV